MSSPVFQVHPFLDPSLSENRPAILRNLYRQYLLMSRSHEEYNRFLNKLLHPFGEERSLEANLATAAYYMNEAMHYVRGLLEMVPDEVRQSLVPNSNVVRCSDVLELMSMIFGESDPVTAWEAQRKLFLTKLFFDIDHSFEVQRGGEHKEYLEKILQKEFFSNVASTRRVDVGYAIGEDGESIDYAVGRLKAGQECWTFDLQVVEVLYDGRPVRFNVYLYSCRFKREVIPYEYRRGAEHYELTPDSFIGLSKRRSASIASKMIRKGESDPRWTEDLIGVMLIVDNMNEVEALKEYLFDVFGGFLRVRNIIDTLSQGRDRAFLNPQSSPTYKVYKAELDVLYNPPSSPQPLPYFFTVEVQLYTLESYLRTIHSAHYANHRMLKQRQFLEGIVPYLWPPETYGAKTIEEATRAGLELSNHVDPHERRRIDQERRRFGLERTASRSAPAGGTAPVSRSGSTSGEGRNGGSSGGFDP